MSQDLLPYMVGCDTSYAAWQKIERIFTSKSKANVLYYKNQLQSLKKGGSSMSEYLLKLKNLIDVLSYAGHTISEENQILQILSGLGSDFNPIMMTITVKLETYTVDEVTS